MSLMSPELAGMFFTSSASWEAHKQPYCMVNLIVAKRPVHNCSHHTHTQRYLCNMIEVLDKARVVIILQCVSVSSLQLYILN